MQLDLEAFTNVSTTRNLASHRGGWIGSLNLDVSVTDTKASYVVIHNDRVKYEGPSSRTAAEIYNAIMASRPEFHFGTDKDDTWERLEPLVTDYAKHLVAVNFWDGTQLSSAILDKAYESKDRLQAAIEGLAVRKQAA